jgi:hypothetical protein
MLLAILGFLCGMVLGFRFKVLILVPTTAFGWALAAMTGALGGNSWTSIALTMVLVALALQAGYVSGIAVRRLMAAVRMNRRRGFSQKQTAIPGAT